MIIKCILSVGILEKFGKSNSFESHEHLEA